MIDFVYNHDNEVAQFIRQTSLTDRDIFGRCKTIGMIDDAGRLIAGLVYFNYDPDAETIEMGVRSVTPRWLTRSAYRRMFEYPFVECGCQLLYLRIRADDEPTLSMAARIGFNLTMVPRLYGRSEDGVLCTLTDEQWLDSRFSKRVYRDVRREREAA